VNGVEGTIHVEGAGAGEHLWGVETPRHIGEGRSGEGLEATAGGACGEGEYFDVFAGLFEACAVDAAPFRLEGEEGDAVASGEVEEYL
jgi:hypothetical protein